MGNKLWDILPKFYEYKIEYFDEEESNNFDAHFRVNLFDEADVKVWLKQFEECSLTNFRVARTAPAKRTRVLFKKYYRCHHNTRASESASKTKKAHIKHTGCEATLLITVNNSCMKSCKVQDLKRFPCIVKYHNFHNHPLSSDELLCHRKPIERIENKIRQLLLKNHTPVSALKILKQDLQQEFKDEYSKVVKDGAFCPKLQWIYHKYYSIFKEICTDPYKIKCFPSELVEECEESNPENVCSEITSISAAQSSVNTNHSSTSEADDDKNFDDFVLTPEDEYLFENHLVEVYTIDKDEPTDVENEDVFIYEGNLEDMRLMGDEIVHENNEMSIEDDETRCKLKKIDSKTMGEVEEVVILGAKLNADEQKSSKLWNNIKVHRKVANEDDLSDIFSDSCVDMKVNSDIFLPSINNKIDSYEKPDA